MGRFPRNSFQAYRNVRTEVARFYRANISIPKICSSEQANFRYSLHYCHGKLLQNSILLSVGLFYSDVEDVGSFEGVFWYSDQNCFFPMPILRQGKKIFFIQKP